MHTKLFLVLVGFFLVVSPHDAFSQERTPKEFKDYVNKRLGGRLSKAQLEEVTKLIDSDQDGKISEQEFAKRMQVIRKVLAAKKPAAKKATQSDQEKTKNNGQKNDEKKSTHKVVSIPAFADSKDATVLLITGDELAKAWVPFAKWKTANGKLTKIVTVGQIQKQYKADSIQEKIRLCVRQHIEKHKTRWVILGGDCQPNDGGIVPGGHKTVHRQERKGIPTDIVYLSPTNWDADKDGIFGEFPDDRDAITYPDGSVGLGRIPVRTAADVAAFTEKVIAYESRYPTNKFATNMIYTCTDSPAYPKVRKSWDGYVSKSWKGTVQRFFSQETPWDKDDQPGSYPLSAGNLVKLFNQKQTGKLHIHGHGHLPAWVLEKSRFTGRHIKQLKNNGAYPLITTVSCNTGEYDSKKDPSIVEQMLRIPNAGSVAVVAPVRTGKPHFAKRSDFRLMVSEGKLDGTTLTMTRYWVNGLGHNASTGHALMKAKHEMAADAKKSHAFHLCICELNLLGDPTLDMRAKPPVVPEVEIVAKSEDKKHSVTVNTNAPGCTVCCWEPNGVYEVKTADKNGTAKFRFGAQAKQLSVTVSGSSVNSKTQKILLK